MIIGRLLLVLEGLAKRVGHRARISMLRAKGVRFGPGLHLEGRLDVTSPKNIRWGADLRIGHDVCLGVLPTGQLIVGDRVYIGRGTIILCNKAVTIGDDCMISQLCHITDAGHGIAAGQVMREQRLESAEVRIGTNVWIGAGAQILPGVTIGDGAVIGARAVVAEDIPPNAVAVGVPARVVRHR